jgi:hypothetical protein
MNPLYDPVVLLQETPYSRWNAVDKNDLLRQGKLCSKILNFGSFLLQYE